jgi:hypothetical protein
VKLTEQVPEAKVHVPELNVPSPGGLALNVMVPEGVIAVPAPVSITDAVQIEAEFTGTAEGEQLMEVAVGRLVAVMVIDFDELLAWLMSPP